ncbi:hypothetical protein RKD20_003044 [Streptomyces sp. SLBN-8D4]
MTVESVKTEATVAPESGEPPLAGGGASPSSGTACVWPVIR